jgi:predicted transcriptional regulator of viral defense system
MNQYAAICRIRASKPTLRMQEILDLGITRYMLYTLRDAGLLEQIGRGMYRLTEHPSLQHPDLVTVAIRHPQSVVCLISALSFHGLTTQIPHDVSIAIAESGYAPQLDFPPVQVYRFSRSTHRAGSETHSLDGVPVRIYSPEKTIADCFKFRNQLGMDIVLEALKMYRETPTFNHRTVLEFATLCRVQNIIRPYLEVLI